MNLGLCELTKLDNGRMCLGDQDGEKENDKDSIPAECYAVYIAARLIGKRILPE